MRSRHGPVFSVGDLSHPRDCCALCLGDGPLVRSHILPEFVYKPAYDVEHRALYFDAESETQSERRRGFWEYILCQACEDRLGRWESYFAAAWFGGAIRPTRLPAEGILTLELDYSRTKLLFLSIIWRASVSRLNVFRPVSLGSREEDVRKQLLSMDPGPSTDFPIAGIALRDPVTATFKDDILQTPGHAKIGSHHVYSMLFGGVYWYLGASRYDAQCPVPLSLLPDGHLTVPIENWATNRQIQSLSRHLQRLHKAGLIGRQRDSSQ